MGLRGSRCLACMADRGQRRANHLERSHEEADPAASRPACRHAPCATVDGVPLAEFHPAVREWFAATLGEPTAPQRQGWPAIRAGRNVLIAAPTGTGKTLAAFLTAIDQLARQ